MKNSYCKSGSVFNDYEESIMFDEDDPDFKPNNDLKFSCNSLYRCNTGGKFVWIKL